MYFAMLDHAAGLVIPTDGCSEVREWGKSLVADILQYKQNCFSWYEGQANESNGTADRTTARKAKYGLSEDTRVRDCVSFLKLYST